MNKIRITPKSEWGKICCSNCEHGEVQYYKHSDYCCLFTCHLYEKERDGAVIGYLDKHFCNEFVEGKPKKTTVDL